LGAGALCDADLEVVSQVVTFRRLASKLVCLCAPYVGRKQSVPAGFAPIEFE
jgi:hypothetical protein